MTNLEKEKLITKDKANQELTTKEQLDLLLYKNEENSILINILKAKYGFPYNGI